MAVKTGISKSLFVNTNASVFNHKEETSTMLLLLNAIAELRNKNIKKAIVEFNQSFIESKENEDLFLSKLLELSYPDLEILFLCFCGPEKNRRSSKQHEKRTSVKKKSSIGDSSFFNGAFEGEIKTNQPNSSLGRKKSLQEENTQGRNCLRKSFYLRRDIQKAENRNENFKIILEIHLKVENFYPCILLFVEEDMKSYQEYLVSSLDNSQKFKMFQLCIFVASNITQKQSFLTNVEIKSCIEHCLLACKLLPNEEKPYELLSRIHRKANETEKALAVVNTFFEEVNGSSDTLFMQKILCLIDMGELKKAMSMVSHSIGKKEANIAVELHILKTLLYILCGEPSSGYDTFRSFQIDENRGTVIKFLEQLSTSHLHIILNETRSYFQNLLQEAKEADDVDEKMFVNEVRKFLLIVGHLLAIKNPEDMNFTQLYVNCLYLCGESDTAQAYLVKMVKEHPSERWPMIYLANLRVKLGAYIAGTEDFRTLYNMWGMDQLSADLAALSSEDRQEIARVHRLHGFRFLRNDGFRESSECFSVAIAALGVAATGLLLSRALCYMHLNEFKRANEDFQKCLEVDDTISAALCARAVLYAVTTHVEEAIADFRKAFSYDPTACMQCLTKLPLEHVLTFSQLVIQYIKQELENISELRKKQYDINELNKLGPNELAKDLDKDIIAYCDFLCKVFPTSIDYVCTYIECLYVAKEYGAAQFECNNAIKNFTNESSFYAWKTVLLVQQRKYEDAMASLISVKKSADEINHILSYLNGKALQQIFDKVMRKAQSSDENEKHGESLLYYNVAVILNNKSEEALRGRLECYDRIGERKKWLRDLSKIIQLQPRADDLCLRARYQQLQGEDLKACEDYIYSLEMEEKRTIEIATGNSNGEDVVQLFHTCAWYMVEMEKPREVFRLCEAGLKFDPTHKSLRQLKEKTRSHVNKCVIQ